MIALAKDHRLTRSARRVLKILTVDDKPFDNYELRDRLELLVA